MYNYTSSKAATDESEVTALDSDSYCFKYKPFFITENGDTSEKKLSPFFRYHVLQIIANVPNAAKARIAPAIEANAVDAIKATIFNPPRFGLSLNKCQNQGKLLQQNKFFIPPSAFRETMPQSVQASFPSESDRNRFHA